MNSVGGGWLRRQQNTSTCHGNSGGGGWGGTTKIVTLPPKVGIADAINGEMWRRDVYTNSTSHEKINGDWNKSAKNSGGGGWGQGQQNTSTRHGNSGGEGWGDASNNVTLPPKFGIADATNVETGRRDVHNTSTSHEKSDGGWNKSAMSLVE